jgi:hypothetical protein
VNAAASEQMLGAFHALCAGVRADLNMPPGSPAGGEGDGDGDGEGEGEGEDAKVVLSMGHRWGAAFPVLSSSLYEGEGGGGEQARQRYFDAGSRFGACGDYFDPRYAGRIEGAALSGSAVAQAIIAAEASQQQKCS